MTDRNLKHLSRERLLEMLIESERRGRVLKQQMEQMQKQYEQELQAEKAKNDELIRRLNERIVEIDEAGNLAEAALRMNQMFENAEHSVQDYMDNIRALARRQNEITPEMENEAARKAHLTKESPEQSEA